MRRKIIILALILFLVFPYLISNIGYGATNDVVFTVSSMNAKRGDTVTVTVGIDCTNSFAAANFVLTYDSNNLEYVPYTSGGEVDYTQNCGSVITGTTPAATVMINSNTAGTLKIGYMSQGNLSGKSGEFLKFAFKVKSNASYGDSNITLTTTTLKNSSGNDLTANFNNGSIGILSGITMSNTSLQMTIGDVVNNLAITPQGGTLTDVVTWTTSNNSVVSVTANSNSKSANVTANAKGIATITASVAGLSATCQVTVSEPEEQYTISINNPSWTSLPATQKRSLTVSFNPSSSASGKTITWSSSKTSVATINSSTGLITAVSNGTTTITATDGNKSATYTLTVSGMLGDIDVDSKITSYDAYRALKLSADQDSGYSVNQQEVAILDVERNNDISANDAYLILKYSIGLITSFN